MASDTRIAVSGIGVVGPGVAGNDALRELLRSGRSAAESITRFDCSGFRSKLGAFVNDFQAKDSIPAAKLRRMNQLSRFAVASARAALDDAGTDSSIPGWEQGGVAIGTMFGPVETSVKYLDEYLSRGAALAPPQLFAESVANAPGSHVAIQYGLRGFNLTFTQREGSAMTALAAAAMQIAKGKAPVALAGGVDEINDITYGIYDRIGALSREVDGRSEAARPFDRNHDGIVLGEGGAMLLLLDDPGELPVYGWIAGFAQGRDRSAGLSDWGIDAGAVERVMRRAIDDAGITAEDVDVVFASANGNPKCDALEARALMSSFGDDCPVVVATKGSFGEYAAGGGLQIAAALLAVRYGEIYPSAGFNETSDDVWLPVSTRFENRQIRYALVNSLSAGGGLISMVVAREASI
ncbi:MAG: hypothetical protein KY432_07970 [Acidobacteria bacterium]|nr:hypothetical protein [Acidobacteriota bacterium]